MNFFLNQAWEFHSIISVELVHSLGAASLKQEQRQLQNTNKDAPDAHVLFFCSISKLHSGYNMSQ